jgi:hypothetical protein
MPQLILDRHQREDFELGSAFMAALTYPGSNQAEARAQLDAAQCSLVLHHQNKFDGRDDAFANPRLNQYLDIQPLAAHRIAERSRSLLEQRSTAARIARPWLYEHLNGKPHPPVEEVSRFSLEQIARHVLGVADPKNFLSRVWRVGLPGIHLAAAVDLLLYTSPNEAALASPTVQKVAFSYDDIDTLRAVAEIAMRMQEWVAKDPRFRVSAEELIWLRWIE